MITADAANTLAFESAKQIDELKAKKTTAWLEYDLTHLIRTTSLKGECLITTEIPGDCCEKQVYDTLKEAGYTLRPYESGELEILWD